jgi:hypothetical protein
VISGFHSFTTIVHIKYNLNIVETAVPAKMDERPVGITSFLRLTNWHTVTFMGHPDAASYF